MRLIIYWKYFFCLQVDEPITGEGGAYKLMVGFIGNSFCPGGYLLRLGFAGYVPLASQTSYPIIVISVAKL